MIILDYNELLEQAFPIGMEYWSVIDISPASLYGFTWAKITNEERNYKWVRIA